MDQRMFLLTNTYSILKFVEIIKKKKEKYIQQNFTVRTINTIETRPADALISRRCQAINTVASIITCLSCAIICY